MRAIAIRLFENKKFGSTFGPGLRRQAVFNATAEINDPYAKYLLDFESAQAWVHHAKTDAQVTLVNECMDQIKEDKEMLWSWVKWYDKSTGDKEYVDGFAIFDQSTERVMLSIGDPKRGLEWDWALPVRSCTARAGKNSPAFLATNYDLAE